MIFIILSVAYLLQKDIFIKYTSLLTMLSNMYGLQQKIPQTCTPKWMLGLKGEVKILCAQPWSKEPFIHDYYTESGSDGCVKIKAWFKIVIQKKPQPGDRLFSILYHGEYGRPFWVYLFLPSRV